ncbi:MAG TPA: LPS export ABC transporter periplasmic protein LptC [Bacteroidetes bacterium]|nr:LPS export ABC transporter periplasmic protein LptC [Bacteroidota bacterium]
MRGRGVHSVSLLMFVISLCFSSCEEKIRPSVLPGLDSKALPQQESWNSEIVLSDSGKLKAIVHAGYIRKFDFPREILLSEKVTVFFYGELGKRTSVLTAKEGKVDELTNNLDAYGNVVVVSEDSTRLQTETLYWDNKRQMIHTPEYVLITSPKEKVQGRGFESDQQLRNYRIFKATGEARTD